MLHNAGQVSLAEITQRQSELAGGDIDLLGVSKNNDWERAAVEGRKDFLRTFYEYAQDQTVTAKRPHLVRLAQDPQIPGVSAPSASIRSLRKRKLRTRLDWRASGWILWRATARRRRCAMGSLGRKL